MDAVVLAALLWLVFVACANYSGKQIPDNISVFVSGWSLGQHGTLDVSRYPEFKPWTVMVDGGIYSDRAPGLIGIVAPFYWVLGIPASPTILPAGVAAATITAAAMSLLYVAFCKLASRRTSVAATLLASCGTATWTVSADAVWPHGPGQLALCLLMLALASERWWLAGFAGGCALLMRPIAAVVSAAAGCYLSLRGKSWKPMLRIGLTSSIGVVLLLTYNRIVFNEWTVTAGSYDAFVRQAVGQGTNYDPTSPHDLAINIAGALASPTRGVLVLSPFLALLAPGIPVAWRSAPAWVRASALGALAYAGVQVYTNNFAGGAGFYGYRYTIESLTLAAPLLLLSWSRWTSRRAWRLWCFSGLAVVSVMEHAAGAIYNTRGHDVPYNSWAHFLLVEAIQEAGAWQRVFIVATTMAAALALVRSTVTSSRQLRRAALARDIR